MYCTNCGAKNEDDSKFCGNCGAPLKRVTPQTINFENTSAEQATNPVPAPAQKPSVGMGAKIVLIIGRLGIILCSAVMILGVLEPYLDMRGSYLNYGFGSTEKEILQFAGLEEDLTLSGIKSGKMGVGFWLMPIAAIAAVFAAFGICSAAAVTGIASSIYALILVFKIEDVVKWLSVFYRIRPGQAYRLELLGALLMFIFVAVAVTGRLLVRRQERKILSKGLA